jgi:transitional endoplasmic reticulum ATPase
VADRAAGSEPTGRLRPAVESFQGEGWTLAVVDWPEIAATARQRVVNLLAPGSFPAPVRLATLSLSTSDGSVSLVASIHSGQKDPGPYFRTLGKGPIGTLLRRGMEAGDGRAVRIVGGLQTAVTGLNRLAGQRTEPTPEGEVGRPIRSTIVVDDRTGLRTTVTEHAPPEDRADDDGRIFVLRATMADDLMAATHLAAFFGVCFATAHEATAHEATAHEATAHKATASGATAGDAAGRRLDGSYRLGGEGPSSGSWQPTLDQVGGLDDVVAQFRDIAASFRHATAMARWGARRPQGILLYGPPGTGKTMLARALGAEIGATVREVRTPDILDKWLGASERNMKRIFAEARRYTAPTVLLFDEFESIIGYAGAGDDSGSHAVNAVAGLFKQEMNGLIEANPFVIVVATTNFPALIDGSLIRSGRFDIKLEIPLPDARGRAQILTRMIRALIAEHEPDDGQFRMFADDIDVGSLAAATVGMSGADLREVLRRAQLLKAMQEAHSGVPSGPITNAELRAQVDQLRAG